MNNTIASYLPPLLLSILLFTIHNLKVGSFVENSINFIFSPLTSPLLETRSYYQKQISLLQSLPETGKQNREQKVLIAHLIWENENLKQSLKESKIESNAKSNYEKVIPIKVTIASGKIIATSTQPLTELKSGMPVVSGNILLGQVTEISSTNINLISLNDPLFPPIPVRGASGPTGVFRYQNNLAQIINVSSQTPLILGDFILTESTDLIPANLLVGKLTKLTTSPQEPLQKGEITLYDTIQNSLENIVVVVKP